MRNCYTCDDFLENDNVCTDYNADEVVVERYCRTKEPNCPHWKVSREVVKTEDLEREITSINNEYLMLVSETQVDGTFSMSLIHDLNRARSLTMLNIESAKRHLERGNLDECEGYMKRAKHKLSEFQEFARTRYKTRY